MANSSLPVNLAGEARRCWLLPGFSREVGKGKVGVSRTVLRKKKINGYIC